MIYPLDCSESVPKPCDYMRIFPKISFLNTFDSPRRLNNFMLAVMSISMVRGGITPNRKMGSLPILHRALEGYLDNLETRPLLTKGISSGIIAGIGNFIQQSLSDVAFVSVRYFTRKVSQGQWMYLMLSSSKGSMFTEGSRDNLFVLDCRESEGGGGLLDMMVNGIENRHPGVQTPIETKKGKMKNRQISTHKNMTKRRGENWKEKKEGYL